MDRCVSGRYTQRITRTQSSTIAATFFYATQRHNPARARGGDEGRTLAGRVLHWRGQHAERDQNNTLFVSDLEVVPCTTPPSTIINLVVFLLVGHTHNKLEILFSRTLVALHGHEYFKVEGLLRQVRETRGSTRATWAKCGNGRD